jgi:hypothetical protein
VLRTITVTRYVTPFREGGSLPALVEADDSGLYVLKFRGAGQGIRALVAELLAGELARAAGLRVPELVLAELGPELGRNEPHDEIRDLLNASVGQNLALDYLPGSITFDPLADTVVDAPLASAVVAFDALVTNVDRTPKNPNMLCWHKQLWLIDHGAALYVHHGWDDWRRRAEAPFQLLRQHVLLPQASALPEAARELARRLTPEVVARAVSLIPEAWLASDPAFETAEEVREAYRTWFSLRLAVLPRLLEEVPRG